MWKNVKLGELYDFKNGRSFKKTEWKEAGLPIIRIQNLNDLTASFNHFDGDYDAAIEVSSGDLLFSWSGTVGSSFGPHIWKREKGVLNQHIFRLTKKQDINTQYAFYCLKNITQLIELSVVGAVGLVHVTKKNLLNFEIPLPPLAEQQRIVAKLDKAFAEIGRAIEAVVRNLDNAGLLLTQARDETFFSGGTTMSWWTSCNLHEVLTGQPKNGKSPPKELQSEQGTPLLTLSAVTGNSFNSQKSIFTKAPVDETANYWINNGDLLITRANTRKLVGHVAIVDNINKPMMYPDLIMKMRVNEEIVSKEFVHQYLMTSKIRAYITSNAKGANPTMVKINQPLVKNIPISYPSQSSQKKIIGYIEAIQSEIFGLQNIYEKKLSNLSKLKTAILAQELQPAQSEAA